MTFWPRGGTKVAARIEQVPSRVPTLSSRIDDIASDLADVASDLKDHIAEDHDAFDAIKLQLQNIQSAQAPHTPTAGQ